MIKVLFVCHGNICRSPMAEYIFKDMVKEAGLEREFRIASAATSAEEIGNSIYPPAGRKLLEHGIRADGHRARQLRREDYAQWDYLIGMESIHLRRMTALFRGDPEGKLTRLLDYTDRPGDISDPWYSDDFDTAWREIERGCRALFEELLEEK